MSPHASTSITILLITLAFISTTPASPLYKSSRTQLVEDKMITHNEVGVVDLSSFLNKRAQSVSKISEDKLVGSKSRMERQLDNESDNGLLGGFLGTVLALPGSVATGLESLLNSLVGSFLGGAKLREDDGAE